MDAALTEKLPSQAEWTLPDRGTMGIIFLIVTEIALFTIFVVAYVVYIGKSLTGPYPKDVLDLPILASICLLSSSVTIVFAEMALKRHRLGMFKLWWLATILLGLEFLVSTGLRVAKIDLRRPPHREHEPVWHHFLFAGWPACQPRDCRNDAF